MASSDISGQLSRTACSTFSGVRAPALVIAAVLLAGCGAAARPQPRIHLNLAAPTDGTVVTNGSVTVSGSVSPVGARVLVLGQSVATAQNGTFSAEVQLQPGTNLVDVLAGAAHDKAAMTAVRVYRQILVTVPNVSNDSPSVATKALQALGLHVQIDDTDPFYSFLIIGSKDVCGISPGAGRRVPPGTKITISVSKTC
jgi:PASTA domain/Glucodextranase, domain B